MPTGVEPLIGSNHVPVVLPSVTSNRAREAEEPYRLYVVFMVCQRWLGVSTGSSISISVPTICTADEVFMPSTATWRPPGVDEENGTVIWCSPLLGVRPKRTVFNAKTKDESEPALIDVPVA